MKGVSASIILKAQNIRLRTETGASCHLAARIRTVLLAVSGPWQARRRKRMDYPRRYKNQLLSVIESVDLEKVNQVILAFKEARHTAAGYLCAAAARLA
jgi:hypothetical protein